MPVARARLYVEPAVATDEEAELLGRAAGSPLFQLRRETYLASGRIVEVLVELLVPDAIRLYVEQSLPQGSAASSEESR